MAWLFLGLAILFLLVTFIPSENPDTELPNSAKVFIIALNVGLFLWWLRY